MHSTPTVASFQPHLTCPLYHALLPAPSLPSPIIHVSPSSQTLVFCESWKAPWCIPLGWLARQAMWTPRTSDPASPLRPLTCTGKQMCSIATAASTLWCAVMGHAVQCSAVLCNEIATELALCHGTIVHPIQMQNTTLPVVPLSVSYSFHVMYLMPDSPYQSNVSWSSCFLGLLCVCALCCAQLRYHHSWRPYTAGPCGGRWHEAGPPQRLGQCRNSALLAFLSSDIILLA